MTEAEAKTLRELWLQQANPVTCAHPDQELESTMAGYLTGSYYCTDCGEHVPKRPDSSTSGDPLPC